MLETIPGPGITIAMPLFNSADTLELSIVAFVTLYMPI
jgi:hypothetical protein